MNENNALIFNADNELEIRVKLQDETVWLTQQQMCVLFDKAKSTVNEHIKNVFKEGELAESSTVRNFRTVQIEGKRQVERQVEHYNLDVIISVGYRVKSLRGTQFRIWATKRLKDYLLKGYAINQQRLQENQQQFLQTLDDLKALAKNNALVGNEDILSLIQNFSHTWFTLDQFDKDSFPEQGEMLDVQTSAQVLQNDLQTLKKELIAKGEATSLFAQEKTVGSLAGIFGNVFQSVFGQDAYPTVEEKVAHLLYFIVKNHPFNDGNKRSGAFAFIWLLKKHNYAFKDKISPQTLGSVVTRYCFLAVCRMFSYQGVKRKALQVMSSIYNAERETFCPDPKGEARWSSYGVKALDNMNNYSLRALPCLITAYLSQKITSRDYTT